MKLEIKRMPHASDLPLPSYATEGSAGLDLLAAVDTEIELKPGARVCVPCGIAMALPPGFEAQVRPRSGLALHHGITLLNAPGTIDSDYRGEVKATLINHGESVFRITRGMKVAQLIVARYETVEPCEVRELPTSERGESGFGSTGLHVATQRTA
ncbi:MAG: dUTP diphosphatase [Alphaproteobacteria bacterium]|nr:dUTP diphosphatase [Alphaproteobacteria bacterium]MDE1986371.1 dUTP diphosphatase [Alphaproteobacteria bacterium]MDE2164018.1 dUTP diphosphatase [Alphaproteobacteria bacterium]MDE2266735.1 dUTP diphosphatase [Alphaproteobacteria bacterium]MDE2499859.1 dUTP diphosphatase [Alphaproteobacteria bacterium]